jgi:hypothetical protein
MTTFASAAQNCNDFPRRKFDFFDFRWAFHPTNPSLE